MTTIQVLDAAGNPIYLSGTGAGTSGDPFIPSNDPGQSVMAAAPDVQGADTLFDASVTNVVEELKATAGALYGWDIANNHATSAVWMQFFNVAAASVVLGTTVPKFSLKIPGDSVREMPSILVGTPFSVAMSYACTATATGAGVPAAAATATFWKK